MNNAIGGIFCGIIIASIVFTLSDFFSATFKALHNKYLTKAVRNRLNTHQEYAFRKEFAWNDDVTTITLLGSYQKYKVFRCDLGYVSYVMFYGNDIVDTAVFDYETLLDKERGMLFRLEQNGNSGDFYSIVNNDYKRKGGI